MYILNYTDLTNSYNISQLFDNLHRSWAFFSFLFFLNIYMCIHRYTDTTHSYNIIQFVQPALCIGLPLFFFFLFFASLFCAFSFLYFLLNIYYLFVHIQLHRLNKFLQYFHNYLTICTVYGPLFFFFFFFFFFPPYASFVCALYVFSFKYLYVHTQLH